MSTVIVTLWGTTIGALAYPPSQNEIATFEFEKSFQDFGIEVSPLKVPTNIKIHTFDDISTRTFHGLPGFIADALPDKFGNQLIDLFFAKKGVKQEDITALDRLLYIGNRSMGALEFEPSKAIDNLDSNMQLNLKDLSELAEMVLNKKNELMVELDSTNHHNEAISLLRIGSSAGGARSKALVALDDNNKIYDGTITHDFNCKYYLLKFDSSSNSDRDNKDPKGMTRVEYIYSLIAKECGINMPNTTYIEIEDDFHFLIERFDRIDSGDKIEKLHYVSWCGMAHAHRDTTGAYGYEQLVLTARELGLGQDSIDEIFRRAVFNIIGRNQDDHTKNFGFLMGKDGSWKLSPAFDMTYSFDPKGKWTNTHQISLNGKQDKFTINDIYSFGTFCNIKNKKALDIIINTKKAFQSFDDLAIEFNVGAALKKTVSSNLRLDII